MGGVRARGNALAWSALAVVYVVWGSTYLAIRVGVRDLPPGILAGSRFLVAGLLLYPIAVRSGSAHLRADDRPSRASWAASATVGVLLLVIGNGGVSVAERTVASGLTAVLVATVPLWMVVFGMLIQRNRVTVLAAAGLLVGLLGVVVLAGGGPLRGQGLGMTIALVAAASWGLGSVLGHRLPLPRRVLLGAAMQMVVAGALLLVIGAADGEFGRVRWGDVQATAWLSLAWLIFGGSILAFTAYGYILTHLPIATVSTYAYVNPVVAVALGAVFLGESFTLRAAIGTALVVGSVALTLRRSPPADSEPPDQPEAVGAARASRPPEA